MTTDYFSHKANDYDSDNSHVINVRNIANAMQNHISFGADMHVMDFGSGTGLLLEEIAPWIKKISAVDVSQSMNQKLRDKQKSIDCELDIIEIDLAKSNISANFNGIVSSMTMHHIEHIKPMFDKFFSLLNKDGFIAIADLDSEDGSFHSEDTGVHHHGFDRTQFATIAKQSGFTNIKMSDASVINKEGVDFPVFLLTAIK